MIAKRSLSVRLTVLLSVTTSMLFLAFWSISYETVSNRLRTQNLQLMRDRMATVKRLLDEESIDPDRLKSRVEQEWATRAFDRIYVRIINQDGSILSETPGREGSYIFDNARVAAVSTGRLTRFEVGEMILVGAKSEIESRGQRYAVELAFDRTNEADLLQTLRESLLALTLLAIVICVVCARWFAAKALEPVREISQMARTINSASLRERIDERSLPLEFGELATTLNQMLDRLEDSFERLSRFSSDMAHELRTPVNNVMGSFGVILSQPRSTDQYVEALQSGIEDSERLKRIIDSLLFIARASNPQQDVELQDLDLHKELSEIIEFYRASAEDAGIALDLEAPEGQRIRAEKTLFQRAIGNLLSNSIRASAMGSVIRVHVFILDDRAFITVADQGTGIDENLVSQLGERFFRPDPSRSSASGGTGLGLSIVKVIAKIHGGRFAIKSRLREGTSVQLDFALATEGLGPESHNKARI